jgi:hypothetical protein
MNKHEFEKTFWYFYLELEHDFLEIEKTIPVDDLNSKTFSYKYMKLLESICGEIDVIFKRFLEFHNTVGSSIGNYETFIEGNISTFKNAELTCYSARYDNKKIYPFKDWNQNTPPHWWTINNKLKHKRDELDDNDEYEWYKHANQENVLNALGGLFQLNLYVYKEIIDNEQGIESFDVPSPTSQIFHLENWGDYYKYLIGNYPILDSLTNVFEAINELDEENNNHEE